MGEEIEVRREDQDKINKFSRLHQHELLYQEELKVKSVSVPFATSLLPWNPYLPYLTLQKEREELDDITTELELADEDEPVP